MAARALRECGATTVRFNFRGTGKSAGTSTKAWAKPTTCAPSWRSARAKSRRARCGSAASASVPTSRTSARRTAAGLLLSIAPPVGRSWDFERHPASQLPVARDPGRRRRDRRRAGGEGLGATLATAARTRLDARHQPLLPPQAHGPARRDQDRRAPWLPAGTDEHASNPSAAYAAGVARGEWQDDAAQHRALRELDRLHDALRSPPSATGLFSRLFGERRTEAPRGLYLWGGVGRGKTFLIDLFYDGLPIARKRRTHFHRFMREVHERLRAHTGERDPLAAIAKQWREPCA
jgi:hypothetical protein